MRPLNGTPWPLNRVLSTDGLQALTQAQINALPVGFVIYQTEAGELVAMWIRDTSRG